MKENKRLDNTDRWIVSLTALCALLLFSWLVYDIAFLNPLLEGQIRVGEIYQTQNRVKRKFNRSLIWYEAGQDEVVYENDWIFTGSQSIAKIKLDGGGEIIVEPDSLIILSRKNGVINLDLQHGRLLANVKNKAVKINVVREGEIETVDTSSGPVEVAQDETTEESNIEDLSAKDTNPDKLEIDEFADRRYYEPAPGFSRIELNGLSYKFEHFQKATLLPGQRLNAEFLFIDPLKHWQKYQVQISKDFDFQNLIVDETLTTEGHKLAVKDTNRYYWRVRGMKDNGEASSWSPTLFTDVEIESLQLGPGVKFADADVDIDLKKEQAQALKTDNSIDFEDEPIIIKWEADKNAHKYRVITSDKKDFSNILSEKIIGDTQLELKNVKLGETYFKVVPETANGDAVAQESVGTVTTMLPAPVRPRTLDQKSYQVMKWDKVPGAKAYEVTYFDSNKEDAVAQVKVVESNRLTVKNKTGFLQWKVRAVDPETSNVRSRFSETADWYNAAKRLASLHGTGQAGRLYPRITSPEPRKTFISVNNSPLFIVLGWDYEQEAVAYDVEVSSKSDMSDLIFKKKVQKRRAVLNRKFKPGIYYMRVRANHENVTDESWSETEIFRVINRDL